MDIITSTVIAAIIAVTPMNTTQNVNNNREDNLQNSVEKSVENRDTHEIMEDLARERILARWEKKQINKWKNLPEEKFIINASAYTAAEDECGKSDGITSSGVKVLKNRTLACPPEYPFGTKIAIDGLGAYTCEDRGGAIKGNHFDIYVETKAEAFAFGRQNRSAHVVF